MKNNFFIFLLLWAIYCLLNFIPYKPLCAICVLIYTVALVIRFVKTERRLFRIEGKALLTALALSCFAIANLLFFKGIDLSLSLAMVCLAAVCEELLFRGMLFPSLKRFGTFTAIVLSSLIFGLFHLHSGIAGAVSAFAFGFALTAHFARYRSLTICVAIHFITNITGNSAVPLAATAICCFITVFYGLFLLKEN